MSDKFGTATPPAVFSSILGLLGIGVAWRRAGGYGAAPDWVGEVLLAAVSILFVFALTAYAVKVFRAPNAIKRDLQGLPGRSGLSAGCVSGLVLAVAILPASSTLAAILLVAFFLLQLGVAIAIIATLAPLPLAERRMNPSWHLSFVGFIVAPIPAISLGWLGFSEIVAILCFAMALTIWIGLLWMMGKGATTPPPLRPLVAINLGPPSLLGLTAFGLGEEQLAEVFGWASLALLVLLLLRGRWIVAAGFSPFWGAFTFPLAAFTNLTFELGQTGGVFGWLGPVLLPVASVFILYIFARVMLLWRSGVLAVKTQSARCG